MGQYKGRITKIEKEQMTSAALTQGIPGNDQSKYDNSNKYHGSNGTYLSGFSTDYYVILYLTIYATETEEERKATMDIRKSILAANGIQRISSTLMKEIKTENEGKKVSFDLKNGKIIFDPGQLKLEFR